MYFTGDADIMGLSIYLFEKDYENVMLLMIMCYRRKIFKMYLKYTQTLLTSQKCIGNKKKFYRSCQTAAQKRYKK